MAAGALYTESGSGASGRRAVVAQPDGADRQRRRRRDNLLLGLLQNSYTSD